MKMIKNNPKKYVRRSDLAARKAEQSKREPVARVLRDFAKAEIDEGFYITFPKSAPAQKAK